MRKREPRILRIAKKLLIISVLLFVVGTVVLRSYQMSLNSKTKVIQDEMKDIQSDIDGLKMKKQDLVSFSHVKKVANKKGYTYKQGEVSATVVAENNE